VKLVSIQDRTAAERLIGHGVFIRNEDRKQLDEGRFYFDQLEGLTVEDEDGKRLGVVESVTENPGNDLLVLKFDNGRTMDLPFVKAYVAKVDPEMGRLVLTPAYLALLKMEEVR
jgi:16S rRNA processing protein RimM